MIHETKLSWRETETPSEIAAALNMLAEEYPIAESGRGLKLRFRKVDAAENISKVIRQRGEAVIEYSTLSGALRGVGSVLAKVDGEERTPFRRLGIMLDVSRGMVMRVEHFELWLRKLALCGCNEVYLYSENTYELDDEPFFSFQRGGYTMEELQELDRYAKALGIELVGCIQTLAHLEQALQHQVYSEIRDTERIMLVDDPKTVALVEKMIAFWSEALSSRRIHVGMDEAQGLGRGRYETLHGPANGYDLMIRHLKRVCDICGKNGLKPVIWSDMFFRLTNPAQNYYDLETPFPKGLKKQIDPRVDLVYWDYYHQDETTYRKMISRHRELGREPIMGSGIWTWARLWYGHEKTMKTAIPCISACRKEKVQELFFTMWGDDCAYCDYDSALAGIVKCSDLAWGCDDDDLTADRFEALCGADYDAQTAAGGIHVEGDDFDMSGDVIPSMLLWDDPLLGIYFDNLKRKNPEFDLNLLDIYDDILCRIMPHAEDEGAGDLAYAVDLIKFLIKKLELRGALEAAYDSGDRLALRELATTTIPAAIASLGELDAAFRSNWLRRAKAQGLERIQVRNAGQLARLEELSLRIREFLAGEIECIEELEGRLPHSAPTESINRYKQVASGSCL